MEKITIRKAHKDDIETILAFHEKLQKFHTDFHPYYGIYDAYEDHEAFFLDELQNPQRLYLLAFYEGNAVGFASAQLITIPESDAPKIGRLVALYVLPAWRKRGIATRLFEERMQWFQNQGASFVETSVDAENETMLHWYEKRGFVPHQIKLLKSLGEE